jgi:hypothetical protein
MNLLTPRVTISAVENRFHPLVKEDSSRVFTTTGPANPAIYLEV